MQYFIMVPNLKKLIDNVVSDKHVGEIWVPEFYIE